MFGQRNAVYNARNHNQELFEAAACTRSGVGCFWQCQRERQPAVEQHQHRKVAGHGQHEQQQAVEQNVVQLRNQVVHLRQPDADEPQNGIHQAVQRLIQQAQGGFGQAYGKAQQHGR